MRLPFRLLDVFAEAPFAGNQLCVVPEVPDGLDTATMQAIAAEIGFSETTFVTAVREAGYDVRIFTPDAELPFAGHPTLGTAYALAAEGRVAPTLVQTSAAGDVPVRVDLQAGRASMRQLPPAFGPEVVDRDAVAAGAGLVAADLLDGPPIVTGSTGIPHLLVPVRDEETLRRAVRDPRACHDACAANDAESLYLYAIGGAGGVVARMFDRFDSIGEDPATGSAAGPLGAYLAEHGLADMPGEVVIAQGAATGRPSFLRVTVEGSGGPWAIDVEGAVRSIGEGTFSI